MKKRKAEEGERVYRILAIPGGFTLSELGESITDAFDFDDHVFGKGAIFGDKHLYIYYNLYIDLITLIKKEIRRWPI